MERLKKIFENLMRGRTLNQLKGLHYLERIGGTLKRPAVLLFVLIYLVTCIPSPQNLTFARDNDTVSESGASADSVEDGKEDSDGGSSSDDASASEEDKGKDDADAADSGQKSEDAKSDDKSEESKSEEATSGKDEGQKTDSSENKTEQKDSSGKTSEDKNDSSDKNGRPSASTEPTAGEKGELLFKKSTKENSYTIRVTGDKDSGIEKVASMNVAEINEKDNIYIDSVKKLNKSLEKKKEGDADDDDSKDQ
jgi:cytoskeletal protein RodZ